jgi:hypothetical protein
VELSLTERGGRSSNYNIVSIIVSSIRIEPTFRVKGLCSPQSVGIGDEEPVEATVGALNKVIELDEVLEPGVEREEPLFKVVNVRVDEGVFDEV